MPPPPIPEPLVHSADGIDEEFLALAREFQNMGIAKTQKFVRSPYVEQYNTDYLLMLDIRLNPHMLAVGKGTSRIRAPPPRRMSPIGLPGKMR